MRAVHQAIDVAATPDECWRVFSDLSTWTSWFPLLKSVRPLDDDPWRVGGRLRLALQVAFARMPIVVEIEELAPGRRVRWVGGSLGVRGNHAYDLDVRSPGLTRFTSHEEFTGAGSALMRPLHRFLDGEAHKSMARFKAMVETKR